MAVKKKVSYVKQHFMYLFLLVVILTGTMGFAVTRFSKNVVGNEMIKLHQALLRQSAGETAAVVGNLKETVSTIAENTRVTEWLSEDTDIADSTKLDYIDGMIQDEIYLNYKSGMIFRIYLYDLKELRYSSDRPEISWKQAAPGFEKGDIVLNGPIRSDEAGLYRHSFYLTEPVRDLLTDEVKGYVLLQFSEKVLYDTYSKLREQDRKYSIIDERGAIVSGENKSLIGTEGEFAVSAKQEMEENKGIKTADQGYMYFYENILGTDWYLLERINVREIWKTLDKAGYFSLFLIVLFVFCLYPLTLFSRRSIVKPVDKIKDRMNEVAHGDLSVRISQIEKGKGEFSEIADSFNYMVDRLEKQVAEIRAMEQKKHLLELDFLRTQINPHFIYNTLSSIRFYVEMGKNEEAEDMLIDFSKILRKTLSKSETMITLREEIETLNHYINLQKARYRDRFEVVFDMDEDTLTSLLPDFILQPIVENAIFYSLKEDKVCHIQIRSWREERILYVSVKDDGIGMNQQKLSTVLEKNLNINKVGIKNVNERLKLNFGDAYGLRIESQEGQGTEVILIMPFSAESRRLKGKTINENTDR